MSEDVSEILVTVANLREERKMLLGALDGVLGRSERTLGEGHQEQDRALQEICGIARAAFQAAREQYKPVPEALLSRIEADGHVLTFDPPLRVEQGRNYRMRVTLKAPALPPPGAAPGDQGSRAIPGRTCALPLCHRQETEPHVPYCSAASSILGGLPLAPSTATRVEPRRPQVGDEVDVSWDTSILLLAEVFEVGVDPDGKAYFRARSKEGPHSRTVANEGVGWRWPATQGAAVAGPACSCGERFPVRVQLNEHIRRAFAKDPTAEHRTAPPQPTVAGPAPCPRCGLVECADTSGDRLIAEHTPKATPLAPATEPHPYAADPSGACVYCGERRCCHDLGAATAAKAALEVQLLNERDAHFATRVQAFADALDLARGNDALAAQLKSAREALTSVVQHIERRRFLDGGAYQSLLDEARAALAASGPVKEGA